MTDPTEHLEPPAVLEQPIWKPRHRVDPMRPANHPITDDAELEELYQDFYQERVRGRRDISPRMAAGWLVSAAAGAVGFLYLVGVFR